MKGAGGTQSPTGYSADGCCPYLLLSEYFPPTGISLWIASLPQQDMFLPWNSTVYGSRLRLMVSVAWCSGSCNWGMRQDEASQVLCPPQAARYPVRWRSEILGCLAPLASLWLHLCSCCTPCCCQGRLRCRDKEAGLGSSGSCRPFALQASLSMPRRDWKQMGDGIWGEQCACSVKEQTSLVCEGKGLKFLIGSFCVPP